MKNKCAGCGKVIEDDEVSHWGHEPDCPNFNRKYRLSHNVVCDCDLHYHPECCPECKQELYGGRMFSLEVLVDNHLRYNHVPAISTVFVPCAIQAIEQANCQHYEKTIELPNGRILTVSNIIAELHLECFLEDNNYNDFEE